MANMFATAMEIESSKTLTENSANVYGTTGDRLLDLFSNIGSLRSRTDEEIEHKFKLAYEENPLLALKMAFYARNIRGGAGERRTFRIILRWLAFNHPSVLTKNLSSIEKFGRWDDYYALVDTPLEPYIWLTFAYQLKEDAKNYNEGKPVSLLAKWMKSENATSKESRRLARKTIAGLSLTERTYRKTLSALRRHIDVVETKMSQGKWDEIKFDEVPSKAMMNYRNAFERQAPEKFSQYLADLSTGSAQIKAGALFPYEILERAELDFKYWGDFTLENIDDILEAQWKTLPNYVAEPANFLIMADTSGSMQGRPMATSVSLAIYFAERNTGVFHNKFMTFSRNPSFVTLAGETLAEKVGCITSIVDSTNLEKAFMEVLKLAKEYKIPQEELPKSIVVISDGEIGYFFYDEDRWDFLSNMEKLFNEAGYTLPKVVMWNVESRADRYIDTIKNPNVQFISGSSPSAFKALIEGQSLTALELMFEVLNDPMYDGIVL